MNEHRFFELLEGAEPTLADLPGLLCLFKKLDVEMVWEVVVDYPKVNPIVRSMAQNALTERIQAKNVDDALDAVATKLMERRNQRTSAFPAGPTGDDTSV